LIVREAIPHRLFGRKIHRVGLAEVVFAALGTGCSVIFPSLMIGIDQSIVSERRKTFGELIDGVLLCGREHLKHPFLGGISTQGDNVTEVSIWMLNPPTSLLRDQAGSAGEALAWTQQLMTKLGLTLNEAKTAVRDACREPFDLLGYSFGPHRYR
jgi:hypothetical protein